MTDVPGEHAASTPKGNTAAWRINDGLWRSAERYRGAFDLTDFGDVLLCLLYLRSRPAWETVARGGQDIEQAIHTTLTEDGDDSTVLRPLLDAVRKVGEARQLNLLVEMVDRLRPASDMPMAQVFNAMLDRVTLAAGKRGGEFHTPESIAELTAALLDPAPTDRILDPCCKAGGFPAAVADRLIRQGEGVDRLTVEISDYTARSCALAYLNLRLAGVTPRVLPSAAESLLTGAPNRRYDVVTANPPFNLSNWNRGTPSGRWRYGVPPAHNSNFAWLQYVAASLDKGGRAAVVMPHGAGLSENAQERSIRSAMLSEGVLSAIIALPGQMFNHTDIPVTLWLLQHPTGEGPGEVLFLDATGLGTVQERARRTFAPTDIDRIVETYRDWCEQRRKAVAGFAAGVSFEEIRDGGFRLNPRAYVTPMGEAPDLREQARQVREFTLRLQRLAEQADTVDRSIDEHLKELSL